MPSLSGKKSENGRLYFGNKDAKYLKKVSRQAVEEHHNAPILFFEIDWARSKKNFYGEMTVKKFKNPSGVPVKGMYKIVQSDEGVEQGIINKDLKLTVSIYVEQLEELGVKPQLGDVFGIGKRLYEIYDKTIEDVGPGSLMMNRGRVRQDFFCFQMDDEIIQHNPYGDNYGLESQINPDTNIDPL